MRFDFDRTDFCDAYLFFEIPEQLPPMVAFRTWGATLLTAAHANQPAMTLPMAFDTAKEDLHVAGYATVTLANVHGGELEIFPYAGSEIAQRFYRWGDHAVVDDTPYRFNSVLVSPYSFCD